MATATLLTSMTLLVSPAEASTRASVGLTPAEISTCLSPLGAATRSPDVLQGWIDGCRSTKSAAYFGNESLLNYV